MLKISVPAGPAYFFIFILFILPASSAWSQMSGSVSLVSDYRFRGHSLSDGRPVPQAGISYDSVDGWYAGGLVSKVVAYGKDDSQLVGYAGYAGGLTADIQWEAGMLHSAYTRFHEYNYTEAYMGLNMKNLGARLYVSPNYPGGNKRTAYLELNGAYPLAERVNLIGHVGFLGALDRDEYGVVERTRRDSRFGLSAKVDQWSMRLEHVTAGDSDSYHAYRGGNDAQAVIVTFSWEF